MLKKDKTLVKILKSLVKGYSVCVSLCSHALTKLGCFWQLVRYGARLWNYSMPNELLFISMMPIKVISSTYTWQQKFSIAMI